MKKVDKAANGKVIQGLREQGYRVHVRHMRRWPSVAGMLTKYEADSVYLRPEDVLATGGLVAIEAYRPDVGRLYLGTAECSVKDPFDHRLGMRIALNRLKNDMAQG